MNRKTPQLYLIILGAWAALLAVTMPALIASILSGNHAGALIATLVIINSVFVAYFWLNGMKDIVYTLYYHFTKKHFENPMLGLWRAKTIAKPRVVMVYCTYNDFNADSLRRSAYQKYDNYEVVILDDSTDPEQIEAVRLFAAGNGMKVIRRAGHTGFKAGNMNNYLKAHIQEFDYFVILDSDEIVPNNFISRALDYFADDPKTGIVQANHIATRNRNRFMTLFAIGVDSHWPAYQSVKDIAGFLSLLGHGAMVSRECYIAAGGFPHMVAEDLCFSIRARNRGYYVSFAPDIICEEEYPVDYLAFKKRHSKWTQGNMEFIKRFTGTILRSKMRWFEKLDIVLFTYNLPLTAFFGLYVVINVIILPLLGYHINYPLWMILPTIAFLFAPMLNDIITYHRKISAIGLGWYLSHSFLLYGSMLYISLIASLKSLFGRSVFIVTPKTSERVSLINAIRANRGEIIFAAALILIAWALDHSILPVMLIVTPSVLSIYMAMMANQRRAA